MELQKLTLLSIRQAAESSGINYSLLRMAVRSGRLKVVTLSSRPMIPADVLQAFIEEANRPASAARPQ